MLKASCWGLRAAIAVALVTMTARAGDIYEAEDAAASGTVVKSEKPGFTGTGYQDYQNATGDYVEWTVGAAVAGDYTLTFRYANGGSGDRPLEIRLNGNVIEASLSFAPTGAWDEWLYMLMHLAKVPSDRSMLNETASR